MENAFSRTRYLDKNTIDGIVEFDLGSFTAGDFDFGEEILVMVREEEECRPDRISNKIYGTQTYWWFIMWYNGISDIWNDLAAGMILRVPTLEKVREFMRLKQNGQL